MKKEQSGLGKHIYTEWLFPVKDYYCSIRKNEAVFEIIIPFLCAIICSALYFVYNKSSLRLTACLIYSQLQFLF